MDSLDYSLKHLVAFDLSPIATFEEAQKSLYRNIHFTLRKISEIPEKRSSPDGTLIDLPKTSNLKLPRILPIPSEKKLTRWEKFAHSKGIVKRKRSRMVWDDTIKDWAPRWGYKSKTHNQKASNPIIELKPGETPRDIFEEKSTTKQIKKTKQQMKELRNQMEASNYPIGVPNLGKNVKQRKTSKLHLDETLKRAQHATASHGRYDKAAHNEATKPPPLYSKVSPKSVKEEKEEYSKILRKVLTAST